MSNIFDKVHADARAKCPCCSEVPTDAKEQDLCGERHNGYTCTRKVGHTGDHFACGYVRHPISQWPPGGTMITPHLVLTYTRPDEVAECFSGVPDELYRKIWNDVVPVMEQNMPSMAEREDMSPFEPDRFATSKYWHLFSDEEKRLLNKIAEANAA